MADEATPEAAPAERPTGAMFAPKKRMTGAKPTPRHRLAAATPHKIVGSTPAQWIVIPALLSYWGNDVDGDCVTAEEAFNKACSGILISDTEVNRWATAHDALNGAYLDQVLDWFLTGGFQQDDNTYNDGPKSSVDWTNAATLQNAISKGPVKIGVAAAQLQNAVGNSNGWFGLGFTQDNNLDHCVALCGYGTLAWLAQMLKVQLPPGVDGTKPGYALYTWKTVGIVDVPSMLAITGEAWVRTPNTVTVGSNPPTPDPVFTPTPTPPSPPPPPPGPPPPPHPPAISQPLHLNRSARRGRQVTFTLAQDTPAGDYVFQSASGKGLKIAACILEVSADPIKKALATLQDALHTLGDAVMRDDPDQEALPGSVPLHDWRQKFGGTTSRAGKMQMVDLDEQNEQTIPQAVPGFNWLRAWAFIQMLARLLGPIAVPLIESYVATLPLTPAQKAAVDALIERLLNQAPAS